MQFQQPAEIITDDHRVLASVKIHRLEDSNKKLYTLIPRSLNGYPVPFSNSQVYNLVYSSYEEIHFLKILYKKLNKKNDKPVYEFDVLDHKCVENFRKEERKSVEFQAVVSDFAQIGFVTILDISYSGMKIETDYQISAEFIEIFFDEENTPKRAVGKVCWSRYDSEKNLYYYGVGLNFR